MEIRFRIDMPRASVRAAAVVLGSLTVMRDGLQLIVQGGADEFARKLNEATQKDAPPGSPLYFGAESLMTVGDLALNQHAWAVLPATERLLLTQAILQTRPPRDDMRLVALNSGSLESVIEEKVEQVGGFFRTMLERLNSVFKGGEGKEFKDLLKDLPTRPEQAESRLLGVGAIIVGAENLRSAPVTQDIRRIYVE
ncbi:MAG: hypothetical protein ABR603_05335 [Pyrinomonadaceae bacterium]